MLTETFGFLGRLANTSRSGRIWHKLSELTPALEGQKVWVRARVHSSRGKGKIAFWVLRERIHAAQMVVCVDESLGVDSEMVKFCRDLPCESVVDVEAIVKSVPKPLTMDMITQRDIELQAVKVFCVSKSDNRLPVLVTDLSRPVGSEEGPTVDFDTQLNNRVIDLRTQANQAIFSIQHQTCVLFREFLISQGFTEIHSPKLIAGASEGGANVFTLPYFDQTACLAQSPQLYKQMVLSGDMDRVFEIGPVFRAENSFTNRHLCEFVGLDMEMTFRESFHEVLDVLDGMFRFIFKGLKERCGDEIKAVRQQYGGEDFVVGEETPKLDFQEMMNELRATHPEIPEDLSNYDPGTEVEKALGNLVKERHGADFYMLINYPQGARPFYTMPSDEKPGFSNSYDFFMRGQEIVSGAQRIHDPELLTERAKACGVEPESIKDYIDAFRYGAYPHGGCGVGLERVVMLFLGLHSVKLTSLFPRDPKRLTP